MNDLFHPGTPDDDDELVYEQYRRARPPAPPNDVPDFPPEAEVEYTQPAPPRRATRWQHEPGAPPALPTAYGDDLPHSFRPSIPGPIAPRPALPPPPIPGRVPRRRDNFHWAVIALFALAATLMTGLIGFIGVRLIAANTASPESTAPLAASVSDWAGTPLPTFAPEATPTIGVEIQPWDGKERFTILMMGLDKRPRDQGTAFRTDSMILVSLDPATYSIGILSIPRDLYVEIPPDTVVRNAYGLQRVNTAYFLGELVQEGYGPKLAMQTVQYNLGIRIHDYIVYDFEAVIEGIDAIGGIEIDVPRLIVDYQYPDMYGGYEPLRIEAGRQLMDGTLALKYARTRHGSSDFDRAHRQQQIITALREKILSLNMLPELLVRAPGLWAQLSRHVRSGLALDQLLRLAVYAAGVPSQNIRQGVLDSKFVQPVNWNGSAVLVPNRAAIGPLLVQVFGPNYNQ